MAIGSILNQRSFSQFSPSSGGQGDSVPTQTVASVPTTDVASDHDDIPPGPEDQSEGKIVDSEGDPADTGIPRQACRNYENGRSGRLKVTQT